MKITNYKIIFTKGYLAPEFFKETNPKLDKDNKKDYDPNLQINMKKSISYTCGKIIENIFKMRKGN